MTKTVATVPVAAPVIINAVQEKKRQGKPSKNGGSNIVIVRTPVCISTTSAAEELVVEMNKSKPASVVRYEASTLPVYNNLETFRKSMAEKAEKMKIEAAEAGLKALQSRLTPDQRAVLATLTPEQIKSLLAQPAAPTPTPTTEQPATPAPTTEQPA